MNKVATGAVLALLAALVGSLLVSDYPPSSGTSASTIGAVFAVLALGGLVPRRPR